MAAVAGGGPQRMTLVNIIMLHPLTVPAPQVPRCARNYKFQATTSNKNAGVSFVRGPGRVHPCIDRVLSSHPMMSNNESGDPGQRTSRRWRARLASMLRVVRVLYNDEGARTEAVRSPLVESAGD